jgi:hypothetical protein
LSVWNYAQTKNEHLRKALMDKWNDILQPIMIVFAAFIIANTFSFNQPLITRLVYASLVLFGETVIEKFVLKIFNRLTRARMLLYSWILISIVGITQFVLILPVLLVPITLCLLAAVLLLFAQFVTLFLYYQLKNEKIIRNYSIDPIVLNDPKYRMFSNSSRIKIRKTAFNSQNYQDSEKLIIYKDFIEPKYSVMAALGYILLSLLIGAMVYELGLNTMISLLHQDLLDRGILIGFRNMWYDASGIRYLMLIGLPILVAIAVMFILFFQDQFTFKYVNAISRNVFLIFLWILITCSALFYGLAFLEFLEGITFSNLIIPLVIVVICAAQYYTIFLITDIALHTQKNMEKLESIYPDQNLEVKSHSELMELLTKIEPRSLKFVKTVNLIFAMIIYCTISVVVYVLIHILTNSVIFSLSVALLVLYGQAELNNYVLKAFSPKINYLYSLISWVAFSLFVSLILPLSLWNINPSYPITQTGEFYLILSNGFYLLSGLTIFTLLSYVTVFILKRILSDYDIKFYWLKYLRMVMYFVLTITSFTLFLQTSVLLALFAGSIVLYIEMVIERYLPIFMEKATRLIRSIAAFSVSVISSYWTYIYLEESFDFTLAFAASLLLFTLLSQLIYNYWEHKRVAGPIYWAVISSEVGFLVSSLLINEILIGIGSGILLMMLYPVIFEYQKFIEFFQNIVENLRILFQKIRHFFKNFWVYMKNFYIKFKIPITLIIVIGICIGLTYLIEPFLTLIQAIFISAAISSAFLFPIFITPKALKDEKTFSRLVYYAAIVYVFANIAIFSFIRVNIVWGLLSLVLFSSILLVVIYRRETLYNLSVRWRFIGLIITILSAIVLAVILVLFFLNIISVNFF